jgi:hypothetical protein
MLSIRHASVALAVSLTALTIAAAARASDADPRPATPSVELAQRLVESASAYETFLRRAGAISPAFADGAAVAEAVKTGAAWEPRQMEEGEIAYAAIIALQDPAFVQSVRDLAADPAMHERLLADLLQNPMAVTRIRGSESAAALVGATLAEQGEHLLSAGKGVKQAAYDIQHQPWSKSEVSNPDGRLADAKTLSKTPLVATGEDTARLMKAAVEIRSAARADDEPAFTAVVARGLAVATLALIGEAGEDKLEQLAPLLSEPQGADCMKMAKLNLFQCLAVARPHYEDVFCLGEHGIMETARCVVAAATPRGGRVSRMAKAGEGSGSAATLLKTASVSVPVATSPVPGGSR